MKPLTRWVAAIITVVGLLLAATAHANPWRALYGDQLIFDVYRNGDRVGQYQTDFLGQGDNWWVEARMELDLKWLFWDYRYRYHATETWQQGQLTGLEVRIDSDGGRQNFSFERQGPWLQGTHGEKIELPVLATHHYDASVVDRDRVINTLTGKVNHIRVESLGIETLSADGKTFSAQRYRYSGDLAQTDVWYDLSGRWVGLEFLDQRGAKVTFKSQRYPQGGYL
ncbi:MAG: hypothetical protein ACI9W6_000906 [Motiliproteus sp.]|jgi:hypothetical protein